jgi:serine/threonine protein kinase
MSNPPDIIADRYKIGELLGVGGMGTVYTGVDMRTDMTVAIKRLKSDVALNDPSTVERFNREAEALRQLNHPNIVKVLDTVASEDGQFIVMEYVSGGTLAQLIQRASPLPMERVLDIGLGLADALARAHHLKIIHRDIKPVNVLIAEDGTPRLTDFGVAFLGSADRLTATGVAVGTLDYLSPEALNGEPVDARADIWAFGVLLYEMLAGKRPFVGDTPTQTMVSILRDPAPTVEDIRKDVPPPLSYLIVQMLNKDRDKRISSARLVGAELEAMKNGSSTPIQTMLRTPPTGVNVVDGATTVIPRTGTSVNVTVPTAAALPARRVNPVVWGAVGITVLMSLITVFALSGRDGEAAAQPTPTAQVAVIERSADVPENWRTYQSQDITISLPNTWLQVTDPTLVSNLARQLFANLGDFAERAPLFVSFAQSLLSDQRLQMVFTDPRTLTFLIVSVEPVGIGVTPEILQSRVQGLVGSEGGELLKFAPTNLGELRGLSGTIDQAINESSRIRANVYVFIDGDKLLWLAFGSSTPTEGFVTDRALYEEILSTLQGSG